MARFDGVLKKREIPLGRWGDYRKWLRYYLDFSTKYPESRGRAEQVRRFLEKLRGKNQTETQCKQAAHAISLYIEMQRGEELPGSSDATPPPSQRSQLIAPQTPVHQRKSQYSDAGYQVKSDSPEWDEVLEKLAAEIKVRHYSRKTLRTYALWSRQFQRFLKNKPPQELSTADVKEYLTYLAVKCKVAASTQNQAFNSLLFLFRHALKREFGELRDVPRAKKSLYVPVVLSREEIDAILGHLSYPFTTVRLIVE